MVDVKLDGEASSVTRETVIFAIGRDLAKLRRDVCFVAGN